MFKYYYYYYYSDRFLVSFLILSFQTNFAGNTAIHSGGALSLYFQKDSGEREEKRQEKEGDTAINSLHVINNIFINNEVKGSGGVGGGVDFGGEAGNEVYALVSGNYFEGNGARGGGNDIHVSYFYFYFSFYFYFYF